MLEKDEILKHGLLSISYHEHAAAHARTTAAKILRRVRHAAIGKKIEKRSVRAMGTFRITELYLDDTCRVMARGRKLTGVNGTIAQGPVVELGKISFDRLKL